MLMPGGSCCASTPNTTSSDERFTQSTENANKEDLKDNEDTKSMKTLERTERQRRTETKTLETLSIFSHEPGSPKGHLTQGKCPFDKSLKRHTLHSRRQAESGACCHQLSYFGVVSTLGRAIQRFLISRHSWGTLEHPGAPPLKQGIHGILRERNSHFDNLQR